MLNLVRKSKEVDGVLFVNVRRFDRRISLVLVSKTIAAVLTATAVGYMGLESFWRSTQRQRERIQAKLSLPLTLDVPRSLYLEHSRSVERRFLERYFSGAPSCPIFIVGPRGTGKSELMKDVMRSSRMSLYMDLHKNPVSSGEEFFFWLVESTGYWVPRYNEITRFLLREQPRKSRITHEELEVALDVLDSVLEKEKMRGWPSGVPIICIDDMYKLVNAVCGRQSVEPNRNIALSDPYFNKFVDWCEHLTSSKLAHLVFVTSTPNIGEIDMIDSFRQRRALIWINHPTSEAIINYLTEDFKINASAMEKDKIHIPTSVQLQWIEKCIGGHVDDLDQFTVAIKRGEAFNTVMRRMISESINFVETRLEMTLKEAGRVVNLEEKSRIHEKYLRLWRLIEVLRDHPYVNRRDIINLIFKDHISELDDYVAQDLVAYLSRGGGGRPMDTEMEEAVVDSDIPLEERKKEMDLKTDNYMMLTEGLGGVIVSAASARLRIAFDSILKHPRMLKQKKRIEDQLKLNSFNFEINELVTLKNELNKERQIYTSELTNLINEATKWKAEIGEESYAKRKLRVIELEGSVEGKLKLTEEKLSKLVDDRQRLTKKVLKV